MIFPIWQPFYTSTHLLAQACGKHLGEKATHTGTLDPMAEGVVVVLTGEDRYAKGLLTDWKKTYQFSILWGLQTDSGDRLGVVQDQKEGHPEIVKIEKIIGEFAKHYEQTIPSFSANRQAGKSAFDWAREAVSMSTKKRQVHLSPITLTTLQYLKPTNILTQHATAVSSVDGDFRQPLVLQSWQRTLKTASISDHQKLLITTHQVTTSPGTYIRQLVQDLATIAHFPATTWTITRTANGPFEQQDCIELDELPGL